MASCIFFLILLIPKAGSSKVLFTKEEAEVQKGDLLPSQGSRTWTLIWV